jgi:hypothetical protein
MEAFSCDEVMVQSLSLNVFVLHRLSFLGLWKEGGLFHRYWKTHQTVLFCLQDATMDIQAKFAKTFTMKGDEQKAARENMLKEGGLCFDIVTQVQNLVASYGKQYMGMY